MKKPHKYPKKDNPAARARELASDWEKLMAKHSAPLFSRKPMATKNPAAVPAAVSSETSSTRRSNPLGMMGIGAKKAPKQYTGGEMLGIAQMHKSNAVPVFKKQDAVEISQMRRG